MNGSISVEHADPRSVAATTLMLALKQDEAVRYADLGSDHFDSFRPDDTLATRSVFILAHMDGHPVGCGALREIDSDSAEINRMYVAPAARRCGVGRAILSELERCGIELGYRVIRLETGNRQPEAITFYESLGFQRATPFGSHASDSVSLFFEKALSDRIQPQGAGPASLISTPSLGEP